MVRLFIAIELSEQQKNEIQELQQKLQSYMGEVRWVKPDGMHLTLKFLGDTEPDKIEKIKTVMDETTAAINQFKVSYGSGGVFPSPRKARVMWIGLREGETTVQQLAKSMDKALSRYGFKPEKRGYKPHLTIGRIRSPIAEDLVKQFIEQERTFRTSSFNVRETVLFESNLTPRGAIHTSLYKAGLPG